jgi:hypothetical protein
MEMWNLRELVERYLALSGGFGRPIQLSQFSLTDEQITRFFSTFDEDYHISRFLHFSQGEGKKYQLGGEEVTHVSIDAAIDGIL